MHGSVMVRRSICSAAVNSHLDNSLYFSTSKINYSPLPWSILHRPSWLHNKSSLPLPCHSFPLCVWHPNPHLPSHYSLRRMCAFHLSRTIIKNTDKYSIHIYVIEYCICCILFLKLSKTYFLSDFCLIRILTRHRNSKCKTRFTGIPVVCILRSQERMKPPACALASFPQIFAESSKRIWRTCRPHPSELHLWHSWHTATCQVHTLVLWDTSLPLPPVMRRICRQIFSILTKCNANVCLKFTQQLKFGALSLKNMGQLEI